MSGRRWLLALGLSACLAAAIFAAARVTTSDGGVEGATPTDGEARTVLTETYERALRTTDALAFCADTEARPTCINQYDEVGGRPAVPAEPPHVVDSWVTGTTRVLTVCGVDGIGHTYRADFPIRYDVEKPFVVILDVFWNSKTYSGTRRPGETVLASPRPQKFSC